MRREVREIVRKFDYPVKWVEEENLHLTLKFLGEVKEERVEEISRVLREIRRSEKRFELSLEDIGAFPSERSPRVIWIGVGKGREEIIRLQERIEEGLTPLGFKKEERGFHPHLTIARVKKRADFKELFDLSYKSRVFLVDSVTLFKSTLTPKGPIYEPLDRFPFSEP